MGDQVTRAAFYLRVSSDPRDHRRPPGADQRRSRPPSEALERALTRAFAQIDEKIADQAIKRVPTRASSSKLAIAKSPS